MHFLEFQKFIHKISCFCQWCQFAEVSILPLAMLIFKTEAVRWLPHLVAALKEELWGTVENVWLDHDRKQILYIQTLHFLPDQDKKNFSETVSKRCSSLNSLLPPFYKRESCLSVLVLLHLSQHQSSNQEWLGSGGFKQGMAGLGYTLQQWIQFLS